MQNHLNIPPENKNHYELDPMSQIYLKSAGRWALFLSILGFIGVGLMIVMALIYAISGSLFLGTKTIIPTAAITVVYIIIAIVYLFPVYYLYKFGDNATKISRGNQPVKLTEAMRFLKNHYQFLGILTIVVISIYFLIFILGMLIAGFRY